MIRLLLVRHGETDWNSQGLYQGRSDIELNQVGLQQAAKLTRRLSSASIDVIYSSDLKRAAQTAQTVAISRNMTVMPRTELRELDLGEFEGKRFDEIEQQYVPLEQLWRQGDWDVGASGGETLNQLRERICRFVVDIKQAHEQGTILIMAHGASLRTLICCLVGIDYKHWWRIQLDGASLSIIDVYPERAVVVLLNDTCHLRD